MAINKNQTTKELLKLVEYQIEQIFNEFVSESEICDCRKFKKEYKSIKRKDVRKRCFKKLDEV